MDLLDLIILFFLLVIPLALVACIILLIRTKRKLQQIQQELTATQDRIRQLQSAYGDKNSNRPNHI